MPGYILGFGATGVPGNYFQIRSKTTAQIANGAAMENYSQARWGVYALTPTEQPGSGCYVLGIPGYLPADVYSATLYLPLGSSPAPGDTPFDDEDFGWDGANIVWQGSPMNIGQINGSAVAAANLSISAQQFVKGLATGGVLNTSQMTTGLLSAVPNIYAGRVMYFTSGVNAGLAVLITAYTVSGGMLTFIGFNNQPAPAAPAIGDAFLII